MINNYITKRTILLNNITKIKSFLCIQEKIPCSIDVHAGRSYIDGSSFMGLMTLDLTNPLEIIIYSTDPDVLEKIDNMLCEYYVN